MLIIYLGAPLLDNLLQKINRKMTVIICVILMIGFGSDQIYSAKHPNQGKGITYSAEKNGK